MKNNKKRTSKKRITAAVASVVIVAILSLGAYSIISSNTTNYAEKEAQPIKEALVSGGATLKGCGGDAGKSIDNGEPYYSCAFEFPGDNQAAEQLINRVAQSNGYALTHASPNNRGHLGAVADIYINKWYFDNTSKSTSSPAPVGPIKLAFKIGDENEQPQQGHTFIRFDVKLASYN